MTEEDKIKKRLREKRWWNRVKDRAKAGYPDDIAKLERKKTASRKAEQARMLARKAALPESADAEQSEKQLLSNSDTAMRAKRRHAQEHEEDSAEFNVWRPSNEDDEEAYAPQKPRKLRRGLRLSVDQGDIAEDDSVVEPLEDAETPQTTHKSKLLVPMHYNDTADTASVADMKDASPLQKAEKTADQRVKIEAVHRGASVSCAPVVKSIAAVHSANPAIVIDLDSDAEDCQFVEARSKRTATPLRTQQDRAQKIEEVENDAKPLLKHPKAPAGLALELNDSEDCKIVEPTSKPTMKPLVAGPKHDQQSEEDMEEIELELKKTEAEVRKYELQVKLHRLKNGRS